MSKWVSGRALGWVSSVGGTGSGERMREVRGVGEDEERYNEGRRTQSSAVIVEARSRTAEGSEASGAERASAQWVIRALVMVERQSTTVPKTSKRSALGGCVVDMLALRPYGVREMGQDEPIGWATCFWLQHWEMRNCMGC